MFERLEDLAEFSVGRACGFVAIGIGTFMIGLYGNMAMASAVGGILTLVTCLVLIVRALAAPSQPYKRTELWLMLRPEERPRPEIAQEVIGTVLRDTYFRFARLSAQLASSLLLLSFVLGYWAR